MTLFLLGCLCGFVIAIIVLFLYAALRMGGDKDE